MTLYEVLDLSPDAGTDAIKAAHRRAVKAHHPDVGGDVRRFERVQRAYVILSDPERRARYDSTGVEDDDVGPSEAQLAQSAISTLIVDLIAGSDDLDKTDIIAAIRGTLVQRKAAHEEARRQIERRLKRVETVRKRLHRKNDEDGALFALLAERDRELDLARSREQSLIAVVARALTLLEDYSYRLDPSPLEEASIWLALKA